MIVHDARRSIVQASWRCSAVRCGAALGPAPLWIRHISVLFGTDEEFASCVAEADARARCVREWRWTRDWYHASVKTGGYHYWQNAELRCDPNEGG